MMNVSATRLWMKNYADANKLGGILVSICAFRFDFGPLREICF